MIALYLGLLVLGLALFGLSFVAQWKVAQRLRSAHPRQWDIIATPEHGQASRIQTWMRLQRALHSPVLPALEDASINRWRHAWRYAPAVGWLCWTVAVGMRLFVH